jgi:methanogenic corrinoid protein MtbC1
MSLDAAALDAALQRGAVQLGLTRVVDEVHGPFLREIGRLWEAGSLSPGHEHFGTTRARTHLLELITAQGSRPDAPRLLATTPSGERHEFGVLLSAVVATGEGWDVTCLGADLPARDIAAAALQLGARVVALSVVHPDPAIDVRAELRQLVELLPPSTRVIVGGEWCLLELRHLARAGVEHAGSLGVFRDLLRDIRAERS